MLPTTYLHFRGYCLQASGPHSLLSRDWRRQMTRIACEVQCTRHVKLKSGCVTCWCLASVTEWLDSPFDVKEFSRYDVIMPASRFDCYSSAAAESPAFWATIKKWANTFRTSLGESSVVSSITPDEVIFSFISEQFNGHSSAGPRLSILLLATWNDYSMVSEGNLLSFLDVQPLVVVWNQSHSNRQGSKVLRYLLSEVIH